MAIDAVYHRWMNKHRFFFRIVAVSLLGGAACDEKPNSQAGKSEVGGAAPGSHAAAPEVSKPAEKELADTAEAAGMTWKRIDQPFGTFEIPSQEGWTVEDNQVEGPDGTVIMAQSQDGITPDLMDEYLTSYDEVQKRDAPKYAERARAKGTVAGAVAARVEGTFDNGTKFVTRDFLVFTKGKVVLLGARTPETNAAALAGVIDHAARSLEMK